MSRKTTPTYVLLNQITLAAASSSVTFSNIPQNYGDLFVSVAGTSNSAGRAFYFYLNGDTGNATAVYANAGPNSYTDSGIYISTNTSSFNSYGQIMDYSATDKHKTVLLRSNLAGNGEVWMGAGRWASTAAVSSLTIARSGYNLNIGTVLSIYGIVA